MRGASHGAEGDPTMCSTKASRTRQQRKAERASAPNIATGTDRQAYRTFSKAAWGSGPWKGELDKAVWTDPATGLDCMHRRCRDGGYFCGYVAVEPGHPLYGFEHDAIPAALGVTAHTGLVESGPCDHGMEEEAMCHVPAPGRPHDVWWLGFKCDDVGDDLPGGGRARAGDRSGIYRTADYVRAECERLALRLAEIARDDGEQPALPAPVPTVTFEIVERVRA